MKKEKKFRTYKGKRIEREETERERRERLLPGIDQLTALGRGIVEEEDEEDLKLDPAGEDFPNIDLNNDERPKNKERKGELNRICFDIPERWAELMTSNPTIQEGFKKRLREGKKQDLIDLSKKDFVSNGGFTRDEALEFMKRIRKAEERSGRTFLNDLKFILEPLIDDHSIPSELVGGDKDGIMNQANENQIRFKGASRAQVVDACNRHGLRTLDQLLQLISHVQSAMKGGLTPKPPKPAA